MQRLQEGSCRTNDNSECLLSVLLFKKSLTRGSWGWKGRYCRELGEATFKKSDWPGQTKLFRSLASSLFEDPQPSFVILATVQAAAILRVKRQRAKAAVKNTLGYPGM